jgi:hypothetical protein
MRLSIEPVYLIIFTAQPFISSSDLEDLENSPGTTLLSDKIKFSKQFLFIFPVLRENYSDRSH